LDPAGKSTDTEIWAALEQCRLKDHIEGMVRWPGGSIEITESELMPTDACRRESLMLILTREEAT
jgi:hypothetical protein